MASVEPGTVSRPSFQRHCLLIANGIFDDVRLVTLLTPRKDLDALEATLKEVSRGNFHAMLLPERSVTEIRNNIEIVIRDAGPEDLIMIYYSGHGLLDGSQLFLAGRDTQADLTASWVDFDHEIAKVIKRHERKRVVILLDCCFSGAAARAFPDMKSVELRGSYRDEVKTVVQGGGFAPMAGQTELEESKDVRRLDDPGQGVYLMTACAPSEIARGVVSLGHGLFTHHLIEGIKSGALEHYPKEGVSLLTVRNLAAYIEKQMKYSLQTPMLFGRREGLSEDMLITEVTLPVPDEVIKAESIQKFQYSNKLSLLDSLGPAYFLNNDFYFVDWNASFETLIAAPHRLRRGQPATDFLKKLDNYEAVYKRSIDVFDPSNLPRVDVERFDYYSDRFGLIIFRKIASRVWDCGDATWCVQLNIEFAQRSESLWEALSGVMEREATWTAYSSCYDEIIGKFPPFKALRDKLVGLIGLNRPAGDTSVQRVLDAGAGTGNSTLALARSDPHRRVVAVEMNDAMLTRLNKNLKSEPAEVKDSITVIRENLLTYLRSLPKDDKFDACLMLNVLFALEDPEACLEAVYGALKPGGALVLSTPRDTTDIHGLFRNSIRTHLSLKFPNSQDKNNPLYETYRLWDLAYDCNKAMVDLYSHEKEEDIRGRILRAGFELDKQSYSRSEYLDCVVVLRAVRSPSDEWTRDHRLQVVPLSP